MVEALQKGGYVDLLLVESPTKAKTLNKFLGKDFLVEASMGHVRDLPSARLSIDVDHDFEPQYEVSEDKEKVIKTIRKLAKKAKKIYLAMDPDREGEAIAFHVQYLLTHGDGKVAKPSDFSRITFHQITQSAVEEAIGHAGKINDQLVDAQQARRVLDRLVGYSLSPVLWKKVRRGLSAGRVQSVALKLIVEREREIEAFKPKEYWEIKVEVDPKDKDKRDFWLDLHEVGGKVIETGKGDERQFLVNSEKIAKQAEVDLKKANYKVIEVIKKQKNSAAKPPFTTSTLQQAAANAFSWTARRTMSVAQRLYEQGLITYHRTDSFHLANEAVDMVRKYVQESYGDKYLPEKPIFYKTRSKSAQEAHEAIRPTDVKVEEKVVDGVDAAGKKLYGLIWRRFVACQMSKAVYDATTIKVEAKSGKVYGLRASGSVIIFDGWKKVYGRRKTDTDEVLLPDVREGELLDYKDLSSEQKFTQPPPRFNDASLVKTLEQLGIGRPSTYAPTISTLIGRGYMERKDRAFWPSLVGITVTDFLSDNFKRVMDYGFTADMEDELDKIADGKRKWVPVIREFWKPFIKNVDEVTEKAKRVKVPVEETGRQCPECGRKEGGREVIRTGRFGKFLSCNRFPDCKYTGKYEEKVKGFKCEKCKKGDVVIKKTRKGRTFYGCSRYPDCDWASWTKPKKVSKKSKK